MSEILTLKASASALISEQTGYLDYNDHSSKSAVLNDNRVLELLCSYPEFTGDNRYRQILNGTAWVYAGINVDNLRTIIFCNVLPATFDATKVTGRNYSGYSRYDSHDILFSSSGYNYQAAELNAEETLQAIKFGVRYRDVVDGVYYAVTAHTAYGSNPPKLDVNLGDLLGVDIQKQLPAAGSSLNINENCKFAFDKSISQNSLEAIALVKAELQWKLKNSDAINTIQLSDEELKAESVTVIGGSFPSGNLEYRFALTANSGAVRFGQWVELVEPKTTISSISPPNGARLNRFKQNLFSCLILADPPGNSSLLKGSRGSVLRWRHPDSNTINEVGLSSELNYTGVSLESNVLPSGNIEYQLSIIDELGRTVETPWVTVSTVDTISTARVETPAGSVEDGEREIVFRWAHINESGTQASKSELQAARPGEAFSTFATIYGSATEHSAPAKSFASGQWQWRVRTYNIDDVAGAWSEAASFVVIASPQTPVMVLEDAGPRPVVRWQTNEQEGYELELNGVSLGTRFGPVQRWTSPDYLENGQHSFRVRVQNVYGLWSDWGMLVFTVANDASAEITLQGKAGREAKLQWQASGFDFYIIYRNGVPIGKTAANQWTDLFAIDKASYRVRGCYKNSDNYGISQELQLEVLPESLIIQAVSKLGSEDWISLRLSQSQHRVTKSSRGRSVNTMQLIGSKYPVAEPEEFESLSIQISCAFMNREECRVLEDLTGKLVCVKTPYGDMAVGYLQNLSKSGEEFYSSYNFSVQHLELEEAIDIDA